MKNFTAAIICAGGSGSRMKSDKNKLLLSLGGVSVFERTLSAFDKAVTIDEIIVSVSLSEKKAFEDILEKTVKNKPYKVVIGGKNREESVKNGISAAEKGCEFVSIHDAARPLIMPEEIDGINKKAYLCGAVCAGTAVKNTVKILKNSLSSILGTFVMKTGFVTHVKSALGWIKTAKSKKRLKEIFFFRRQLLRFSEKKF